MFVVSELRTLSGGAEAREYTILSGKRLTELHAEFIQDSYSYSKAIILSQASEDGGIIHKHTSRQLRGIITYYVKGDTFILTPHRR